jgi:hypothetical protein
MANPIAPSISQNGRIEPFDLQVARGQIFGHSVVHVFGHNPDVDQTEVTIWPALGLLGHPASPTIMKISSSSVDDTSTGTGARTVYILGINGTGGYVSETVTLNGQTAVNTTHEYDAIERLVVASVGSGGVNAGTIYAGTGTVTAGVPATPYSAIGIGDNTSLVGHWTCPAGHTGYLVYGSITSGDVGSNQYIVTRLKQRGQDGIIRTAAIATLNRGSVEYPFTYPVKILEGECITATAKGSSNNNDVSSYFQIVLIKNDGSL